MNNRNYNFKSKLKMYTLVTLLFILLGSLFYNEIFVSNLSPEYKESSNNDLKSYDDKVKETKTEPNSFKPVIMLVVIADSHLNNSSFNKIRLLVKEFKNIDLIVHLGDHTDFGDIPSLIKAKEELDSLNVPYVSLPGDRDLAATSSEENFYKVFQNKPYLNLKNIRFTFFNNSRNFLPYPDSYIADFIMKINNTDFLFSSQPIFVAEGNLFTQKYMGSKEAFPDLTGNRKSNLEKYSSQRDLILSSIRNSEIKLVVSGDHHRSAEFKDPINNKINYHIVGATAEKISFGNTDINQESLQSQRISLVEIGPSKEYKITEIILNEK